MTSLYISKDMNFNKASTDFIAYLKDCKKTLNTADKETDINNNKKEKRR